jgi:hypothetical protein
MAVEDGLTFAAEACCCTYPRSIVGRDSRVVQETQRDDEVTMASREKREYITCMLNRVFEKRLMISTFPRWSWVPDRERIYTYPKR